MCAGCMQSHESFNGPDYLNRSGSMLGFLCQYCVVVDRPSQIPRNEMILALHKCDSVSVMRSLLFWGVRLMNCLLIMCVTYNNVAVYRLIKTGYAECELCKRYACFYKPNFQPQQSITTTTKIKKKQREIKIII